MGGAVVLIWFVGVVISSFVYKRRAGVSLFRGLKIVGPFGVGVTWLATNVVKMIFWPFVLVYWLSTGRPEQKVLAGRGHARRI